MQEAEIDFKELLRALWGGKWLILSIASVAVSVGLAYIYQVPDHFSSSLSIKPITVREEVLYSPLDDLVILHEAEAESGAVEASRPFSVSKTTFTKTGLIGLFLEKLEDRELWKESFDKVYASKKSEFAQLSEYNDFLNGLAYSPRLVTPTKEGEEDSSFRFKDFGHDRTIFSMYPEILFDGNDLQNYLRALQIVIDGANEEIRKDLVFIFDRKIERKKEILIGILRN